MICGLLCLCATAQTQTTVSSVLQVWRAKDQKWYVQNLAQQPIVIYVIRSPGLEGFVIGDLAYVGPLAPHQSKDAFQYASVPAAYTPDLKKLEPAEVVLADGTFVGSAFFKLIGEDVGDNILENHASRAKAWKRALAMLEEPTGLAQLNTRIAGYEAARQPSIPEPTFAANKRLGCVG